MNFFYSAAAMGFGNGYWWHRFYKFPILEIVTKTLTLQKKIGYPFAIMKIGKSVYNKVSLHNIGFSTWLSDPKYRKDVVVSISGNKDELFYMIDSIENAIMLDYPVRGVEINISCPNTKCDIVNTLPICSGVPTYLKLSYKNNPHTISNIDKVSEIRMNAIPLKGCGGSGKIAQKYNWPVIKEWIKDGLNVAGCSALCKDDIKILEDIGCRSTGIGSVMLINPKLVEKL